MKHLTDFKKINGITQKTKYYLGDYEEETDNLGNIKKIHYLSGGAILINANGVETLYYGYSDYQGNLIALANESGTVVERYAYDPWGKRRNPADWTQDDTRTSWIIDRGYTMHEHLDQFGIINMNGRVYDPLTAMFFSPDPFVQAPGNWLNFNRYSYAYGNPFKYVDPDGEWIHFVVGAVAGGLINWISNGCEFTWEGLSYFGAGALAGLATAAAPGSYALINAGLSATNNFIQQGFDGGIGNVNFTQVAFQGMMGGAISFAGGEFGKALHVDKLFGGIDSPLLKNVLTGVTSNTIVGGFLGGMGAIADSNSETKFLDGVWSGIKMGVISGTIGGVAGAINYSHNNHVDLFTGNKIYPKNNGFVGTPRSFELQQGQVVDRYGGTTDRSSFVSPEGTLIENRSLHPNTNTNIYERYEVLQPFSVQAGRVAPFYGQPGMGTQYQTPQAINILVTQGFLRLIP